MATQVMPVPYQGRIAGVRRFSVAEYHRLIELGILTEADNLELLDGYLVHNVTHPSSRRCHSEGDQDLAALAAAWMGPARSECHHPDGQ
ncbi:MAG TPA: hypothetical protein VFA18_25775 [Gemmataceae bacterium]|nr:hypothetical protein [Gemmataceae bacterium]